MTSAAPPEPTRSPSATCSPPNSRKEPDERNRQRPCGNHRRAGNTLGADVLGSDPQEAGGRRVIFVSGDDVGAKSAVASLFQDAGFAIDLGNLATGGAMQQIHHPLAGLNLIRL